MTPTEQNIEKMNRMIAEWMGMIYFPELWQQFAYANEVVYKDGKVLGADKWYRFSDLQYHTSFDWLMPVVQNIGKEYPEFIYDNLACQYALGMNCPRIHDDISVIYEWVCKVIEWINKNKEG